MPLLSHRPASISRLVLIGFALVALPLIAALVGAVIQVGGLARLSQQALFNAAATVQGGRVLVSHLTAMERHARQYRVLGDQRLHELYLERRRDFRESLDELRRLQLPAAFLERLAALSDREQRQFESLRSAATEGSGFDQALEAFADIALAARALLAESGDLVGREAREVTGQARDVQRWLLIEALALTPVTMGLAALFVVLITRPLGQIDQAIRRLGDGQLGTAIAVRGSRDLEDLGKRLDWLRGRLVELEDQKTAVLRHISHDLKTPLTAIREGAELLADGTAGTLSEEQREIAAILRDNGLQLQRRIEDLLSFSVQRTPQPVTRPRPVDLQALIDQVLEGHSLALRTKSLRVVREVSALRVVGDRDQLRAVIDNLLSNAIKYSPAGAEIRLRLAQEGDLAVVDVEDQGPGIAREERTRVFDAFYQGRSSPDAAVPGTGLGLAIARQFVSFHQGSIEVLDAELGAHLRVRLPLSVAEHAA